MENQKLLQTIEDAAEGAETSLNLSNLRLTSLPSEIEKLTNITSLDLRYNQISTLPPEIGNLHNLIRIDIGENKLVALPPEIGKLIKLETLIVEDNQLTQLPKEIKNLKNLKYVFAGDNRISIFPNEMADLKNLQELTLRDNRLTTLPPEIGKMTHLSRINLKHNKLTSLPAEIRKLSNLPDLDLRGNPLNIPDEILSSNNNPAIFIEYYFQHPEKTRQTDHVSVSDKIKLVDLSGKNLVTFPSDVLQKDEIEELDLRHNQLTSIPSTIAEFVNLVKLDLGGNQLSLLPADIGDLSKLMKLNLGGNRLTSIPSEIGKLTNLESLNLGGNMLSSLPDEIGDITNLRELDLRFNQFSVVPQAICKLINLKTLHLLDNQISTLPPDIKALKNLKKFHLMENRLSTIPAEIGELISLTSLAARNNRLVAIPGEIKNISTLTELDLRDNLLMALPPEIGKLVDLKDCDLRDNQLKALPIEMENLTNLQTLDLRGNPLPIPPEILSLVNEPKKILHYYFEYEKGQKQPLNEAKVVIVGQGAVGKTSLVKRLLDDQFNPHETKTDGIEIKQWNVNVENATIRLNLWDFGGQEIMHATHQFFLTKRSLYLLVLDSRLDDQENRVEYWLKLIQSFGGNSPIIVVCNKSDENDLDLNWRGLQEKYPTIKAFAKSVSCKLGRGIDELKLLITQEVSQLEHIHDELILSWFAVKSKLEKMQTDYISYEEYQKLCEREQISDELSQQTLLGFLHDLGIVLHFHEHPVLEETNVLNPEWVTKGVYQIVNSYELFQNKGELSRAMLSDILDTQQYPRKKQQFILDVMRQFELCFDFYGTTGDRFLIPDLLPKEEPDTGNWQKSLTFQYHYDVLPSSVISRFIVRMHIYISKHTYWRNGVVLISEDHNNRALVKADIEDKKIYIDVSGKPETRRVFLEIVRAEFRRIHATIPEIQVSEKVPLPEEPKVVVDYKHLLRLESLGRDTYFPEGAAHEINVSRSKSFKKVLVFFIFLPVLLT